MPRILLATHHLFGWTGSEITVATLGRLLREAGHEVLVYAPHWGRSDAGAVLLGGLPATQRLADVANFQPDAAYTQHHPVAVAVRAILPHCPMAHGVLGVLPFLERPPRPDLGLAHLLPISEEVQATLRAAGHTDDHMELLRNLVDDQLFTDAGAPPTILSTVACHSYKLAPGDLQALQAATQARNLALRVDTSTGPGSAPYADAPRRAAAGEIIVASGRGAIEAMLCGRVPLILADCGDDGLVTPDNFAELMRCNFSGRARGGSKFDAERIGVELDGWRPALGPALQALARQHFGTSARRAAVLNLFGRLCHSDPVALPAAVQRSIAAESEGLELQRHFTAQATRLRGVHASAPQGLAWRDLLSLGHAAWRSGDVVTAQAHYAAACQSTDDPVAQRSLVSLGLTQLAARERRAGRPEAQRAALQAFLLLNPGHAWATAQLASLPPGD